MSTAGLIIGVILLTCAVILIALPLLGKQESRSHDAVLMDKQRERLEIYYQRVLRNIRDLDEDFDLGKINGDDYTTEREFWMTRGVLALKALDNLDAQQVIPMANEDNAAVDRAIHDAIEAAVSAEKAKRTETGAVTTTQG